jgi:flavin-binding protein dodecin
MESKLGRKEAEIRMSVARVTELSATSETGFEDAINQAVARATKTLRGVEGAWVKGYERHDRGRQHSWLQGQCRGYLRAGGVAPKQPGRSPKAPALITPWAAPHFPGLLSWARPFALRP